MLMRAWQPVALELADSIEFLGASLGTTSSLDASAVRLNVPVARLQDALPLMADVALRSAFPEKELDRVRQERITALLQARDDPASVATMAFSRVVFGAGHRYGTAANGTEATLKAFTVQDLRAFHSAMYRPANTVLIVGRCHSRYRHRNWKNILARGGPQELWSARRFARRRPPKVRSPSSICLRLLNRRYESAGSGLRVRLPTTFHYRS
jgi:hypothetical protein